MTLYNARIKGLDDIDTCSPPFKLGANPITVGPMKPLQGSLIRVVRLEKRLKFVQNNEKFEQKLSTQIWQNNPILSQTSKKC